MADERKATGFGTILLYTAIGAVGAYATYKLFFARREPEWNPNWVHPAVGVGQIANHPNIAITAPPPTSPAAASRALAHMPLG